jgi:hypothetical protein
MRIFTILLMLASVASAGLVNDGSFENGTCGAGSAWTCLTTTPECETIVVSLDTWGFPAFDGINAVWLGGTCSNVGISNSVCQDIFISPSMLSFWWMGTYSLEGEQEAWLEIRVDGALIFQVPLGPEHHTIGTWSNSEDTFGLMGLPEYEDGLSHTLCIGIDNLYSNNGTTTVNLLVDLVELNHPVATEGMSFSTLKVLY